MSSFGLCRRTGSIGKDRGCPLVRSDSGNPQPLSPMGHWIPWQPLSSHFPLGLVQPHLHKKKYDKVQVDSRTFCGFVGKREGNEMTMALREAQLSILVAPRW